MKKIMIGALALLMVVLTGCSKGYDRDTSQGEVRYVNYSDILKMREDKKSFLVMLTMPGCSHCEDMEAMLDTYLQNHHVIVYNAPLVDDEGIDITMDVTKEKFPDFAGTPDLNYIKKGAIEDHFSGYMSESKFDEFVKNNEIDKK